MLKEMAGPTQQILQIQEKLMTALNRNSYRYGLHTSACKCNPKSEKTNY